LTQPTAPNEILRDAEFETLVTTYRGANRYSRLSDENLLAYYRQGKRFRVSTGRLVGPESRNPDFTAQYSGDEQLVALNGGNRADLSTSDAQTLDGLLRDRDEARDRRDNATSREEANQHEQQMRTASRQIGEHAGRVWVQEKYPGPPPPVSIYPPDPAVSSPGDFDQIFECTIMENGQKRIVCIINEAKGGASPLGTRMASEGRAQQGTPEYYASILTSMEDRKEPPEAAAAAAYVRSAQSVEYCHVHAPIKHIQQPDGTVRSEAGQATVKTFDLSNREPIREPQGRLNPSPTTTPDADAERGAGAAPSGQTDPATPDVAAPVMHTVSPAEPTPAQGIAAESSTPADPTTTPAEAAEPATSPQAEGPETVESATHEQTSTDPASAAPSAPSSPGPEPVSEEDAELAQMRSAAEPGTADTPRSGSEPGAESKPAGARPSADSDADELAQMHQASGTAVDPEDSSQGPGAGTERTIGDDG